MLLNGHIDEMVYERRGFDQSLPFEKLKQRSLINSQAHAADRAEDFSKQIRLGLPGFSTSSIHYETTERAPDTN